MSTDPTPLDDLDLSAVLDDEATDDVLERLDSDPEAQGRLDRMRAARAALADAAVPELPADVVDDLVANAISAGLDSATAPVASDPEPDTASDDDIVAPLPSRSRSSAPPWLVAAVVVVLVGIGLTLVWSGRGDVDDDVAFRTVGQSIDDGSAAGGSDAGPEAATGLADDELEGEGSAAGTGEAAETGPAEDPGETPTTTAPGGGPSGGEPVLIRLGDFDDADALRVHLRDAFPTESVDGEAPGTDDEQLAAAFRCLGKVDGLFGDLSDPTHVGTATVAGEPVVVYELPYRTDEGRDTSLVMAVGEVTCIPVLTFQR